MSVSKEQLFKILDVFDSCGVTYWMDGGWGVDVLYGKQTRDHRDVDINFDARYTEKVLKILKDRGYVVETDWLPIRAELKHPEYGYLDLHPFELLSEGARQANPEGGYWVFPSTFFGCTVFSGRTIHCISLEGQKAFHSGYEPREKDLHDIKILETL